MNTFSNIENLQHRFDSCGHKVDKSDNFVTSVNTFSW